MNVRERFQAVMGFRPYDRLPLLEWAAWWDQTIARWHGEGLPRTIQDRYDLYRHFGLDLYRQDWVQPVRSGCPAPASHGAGLVASLDDYERLRPYLYPEHAIADEVWQCWAEEQRRGEAVLWFTLEGFFWFPRRLLGIERHLYAFYDQPELIHRINTDLSEWMLRVIARIGTICAPDFMTFAEDLSYNHGPMLSQELFAEFLRPYYDRVVPALRQLGTMPIVDSDGDVTVPAQWFAAAGIDGILPLERQAGVDLAALRTAHPRMRFIGHFDKMTMTQGEAAMHAEFARLLPLAAGGGFLVSCDHQTPPQVSYQDYQTYLALFRKFAEEAGALSRRSAGLRSTA